MQVRVHLTSRILQSFSHSIRHMSSSELLDLAVAGLAVCNSILLKCCSITEPSSHDSTLTLIHRPIGLYSSLFRTLCGGISWRRKLSGVREPVEIGVNREKMILALACLEDILAIVEKVADSVENWFGVFEVLTCYLF